MPPGPRPTPPKKKPYKPDRAEGYAGKGQLISTGRMISVAPSSNMSYLDGSSTKKRESRYVVTPSKTTKAKPIKQTSVGRIGKKANLKPSKPDRAEGYGKGKWVPTGRHQIMPPGTNWSWLDGQGRKVNIPRLVEPANKPMGRPVKGGSGVNAKPTKPTPRPKPKPKKAPTYTYAIIKGKRRRVPITSPMQSRMNLPGSL